MKCVLLFTVIFAAWVGSSDAVMCSDIGSCAPDMSKMNSDNGNIEEACKELTKAFTCFRGALDDCRSNKNMPTAALNTLQEQMDQVQSMISDRCGSSSATTFKISTAVIFTSIVALFV